MKYILDPRLALYLPLYEPDGSPFMSSDTYGHVCTRTGALWRHNGNYFDGVGDAISIPHHDCMNWGSGDGAAGIWFRTSVDNIQSTFIIKGATGAGGKRYQLGITREGTGKVSVEIDDNTSLKRATSTKNLADNNWHFAMGVKDGDGLKLYIDGVQDGPPVDISGYGSLDSATGISLGQATGDTDYIGYIGEAWIYTRAPAPLEIHNIFLATRWRYV